MYTFNHHANHSILHQRVCEYVILVQMRSLPDSKVHGANMEPTWGWQVPDGPRVGHVNLAI